MLRHEVYLDGLIVSDDGDVVWFTTAGLVRSYEKNKYSSTYVGAGPPPWMTAIVNFIYSIAWDEML